MPCVLARCRAAQGFTAHPPHLPRAPCGRAEPVNAAPLFHTMSDSTSKASEAALQSEVNTLRKELNELRALVLKGQGIGAAGAAAAAAPAKSHH